MQAILFACHFRAMPKKKNYTNILPSMHNTNSYAQTHLNMICNTKGNVIHTHFDCLDKFVASQSLGYENCLNTPKRYLYTKKFFKTKRMPSPWRYWRAIYQWWHFSNKWQYCLHVCGLHEMLFRKCENTSQNDCLLDVFWRVPNIQEHPTCEKHRLFGYSRMAVFDT